VTQYIVLRDLAIIFAVSLLVIWVFHRIKLPALPGFIVAGVLVGPNGLGLVSDVHQVESLAEVGVILLLFTIGIEFSLSRLREMGRQVVVGGGSQVILTTVLATLLAVGLGACLYPTIATWWGLRIGLTSDGSHGKPPDTASVAFCVALKPLVAAESPRESTAL